MKQFFKAYAGLISQDLSFIAQFVECSEHLGVHAPVSKSVIEGLLLISESLLNRAQELGLKVSPSKAASLSHFLRNTNSANELKARARDLQETMVYELHGIHFMPVTKDMMEYSGKNLPFGKAVSEAFSQCSEDISEAHECFGFGRYTASMFHLGRAMEIAVKRTAKKMGVTAHRDEWQAYLSAMQDKIGKMPFKKPKEKAKRAIWSEVTGHFFNFKEAWRNPTFHAKKTYTREEALAVLTNAGAFMDCIARKVFNVQAV